MLRFKFGEKLPRWPRPSLFHILQSLPDAFLFIRAGCDVEQALIGIGVLHNGRSLPVSTTGRLLFLSCFMKSPDWRRKVVSDWMSLVMSSMTSAPVEAPY
jgi:hypothetical protein